FDMAYRLHSGGVWSHQNSDEKIKKTQETAKFMLERNYFEGINKFLLFLYHYKLNCALGKGSVWDKVFWLNIANIAIILRIVFLRPFFKLNSF
ncbi:MAG: hypothetical protein NT127_00005, partial [Sphingobacteriales bacterium]|nr:hypothetical protein [Sphingobacteriales bacterium]